tara:strand:+ start:341 stop:796 length:456 start_codon:yes stop_codon:yes gene_type:complete
MEKKKIVYIDGIWDLFHFGHVNFIRRCKEEGDFLIVGVTSDEDCEKIKRKPILTMNERVKVLESCKYIDKIIAPCLCTGISQEFITKNKIDLVIHADDYSPEMLEKYYSVPIKMGKFKSISYTTSISTTDIINRLTNRILNKYINGHPDNI